MAAGLERATAVTGEQHGKIVVIVPVAVADATAIDNHAIVQERALALLHRFEFLQKVGELRDVEPVDFRNLRLLLLLAAVVRQVVVAVRDANERIRTIAAVVRHDEGRDARYFEYYFRNLPHIIRKNRSSCAILMGEESTDHLMEFGQDVFSYFGLGCRNVSKLYVPEGYAFDTLLKTWEPYKAIADHHKYANNYWYQKSIMLMDQIPFLDNGFVILTQKEQLVSPISVVYYETYNDQADLKQKLEIQKDKIQCMVSANGWFEGSVPFGKAQMPELWDYSDGIDTMRFLGDEGFF